MSETTPPPSTPSPAAPPPPPPPPAAPPRPRADHRDLSRVVLYYALALAVILVGVAALLIGIAWSDLADIADNNRGGW
ncbi:hypothetical protein ACIQAC_05710 [Streptomyces sp. NPDC088387]|uniref:hypothetical protein n=1 Tax=Streptomyces sp. NPDC088387 TaxID=3365859 RepID=UPI0037F94E78